MVDAFNAVLPAKHGADALSALKGRFTEIVERDDNVPCRAALEAVQAYQRQGHADHIDKALRRYGEFVTKEYELAAKHSQRKQM